MGILDTVRASKAAAVDAAPPVAPTAPAADATRVELEARKAAFLEEEKRLRAQAAPPADKIVTLTGAAAAEYAAKAGIADYQLGSGIQTTERAARAAGVNVVPPDAPASGVTAPAAQAIPSEELKTMSPAIQAAAAAVAQELGGPAVAPPVVAQGTMGTMQPHNGYPPVDPPAPKRRGRPKKIATATPAAPEGAPAPREDGLALYVNCEFDGVEAESLDDYVGGILAAMAEDAKLDDVRLATGDSHLAFGRWKAALSHVLRTHPPRGAWYVSDVAESEVRQVALEALWPLAAVRVRGRR